MVTEERAREVVLHYLENGETATCEQFGITATTLDRYKRRVGFGTLEIFRQIKERFSPTELKALARGKGIQPWPYETPTISFDGREITFLHVTDSHIGSIYFVEEAWDSMVEECGKRGIDFACVTGDLSEGMSTRTGHIYELSHIGYDAQKEECIKQYSKFHCPIYAVDGNHDRWYFKENGAIIVKDICERLPEAHFLGHDEADIDIDGARLRMFHGEDGNSYATSYRIQKLIESYTGGDKPGILLVGHTHKQISMFERNVHCNSGGAMCKQHRWMRRTKKANHMGFTIIRTCIKDREVKWFEPRFYPFYL